MLGVAFRWAVFDGRVSLPVQVRDCPYATQSLSGSVEIPAVEYQRLLAPATPEGMRNSAAFRFGTFFDKSRFR